MDHRRPGYPDADDEDSRLFLSTGLLFAATARGFGYRKFWISVPVGIVFAFVIWFIFARGLQLSLPSGWLEQFV